MGTTEAADPGGNAGRATAQNRHAFGDECDPLSATNRVPLAVFAEGWLSTTLDRLQHLSQISEGRAWDVIWAHLHADLREKLGREASPTAGILDSQSLKSAEKGVVKTTSWGMTPARR
jgi:hypothetical protein